MIVRKMYKILLLLPVVILMVFSQSNAQDFPAPGGYINDFANIISPVVVDYSHCSYCHQWPADTEAAGAEAASEAAAVIN